MVSNVDAVLISRVNVPCLKSNMLSCCVLIPRPNVEMDKKSDVFLSILSGSPMSDMSLPILSGSVSDINLPVLSGSISDVWGNNLSGSPISDVSLPIFKGSISDVSRNN